jgi:hypothetical protein
MMGESGLLPGNKQRGGHSYKEYGEDKREEYGHIQVNENAAL